MAIELGSGSTSAPNVPNAVSAVDGVVKTPSSETFDSLLGQVKDVFQGRKEDKQNAAIADFTKKQVLITDGLDQNKFRSAAHARTLMRRNFLDAVEANPGMTAELVKAQRSVLGLFGDTGLVSDGTLAQQRVEDRKNQLVTAGLLDSTHTEEEFKKADRDAQIATKAQDRYDSRIDEINLELKEKDLTDSRKAVLKSERTEEAQRFLRDRSPLEVDALKTTFNQILNSEGSEADKIKAIEDTYIAWRSQANALVTDLDSGEFTAFLAPFEQLQEVYLKRARGELEDGEVKREIDRIMAVGTKTALQDPALANIAVASKLFDDPLLLKGIINNDEAFAAVIKFLGTGVEEGSSPTPFVTKSGEKVGVTEYLKGVTRGLDSSDPEVRAESEKRMSQILNSVEDYEGIIKRDPKAGIALVNFLSNPDFLKAVKANPDLFSNSEVASQVIKNHYDSEVWGMVKKEFKDKVLFRHTDQETGEETVYEPGMLVEAVPSVSGMKFIPIEQDTDGGNAAARREASRLNSELAPVINTTIKAGAHLEGHNDYQRVWEETSEQFLGGGTGDNEVAGGEAEDDLVLDDFVLPQISSEALPKEVAEDAEFLQEISSLAKDLDVPAEVIMAVMDFETGGSFDPAQRNAAGSSATGLIQFMAKTAKGLGTSTEELASMTRTEQMVFVRKYFEQYKGAIAGGDARDVYMAVLFPKAINKADDYVLFREGTKAYKQNKGLDRNGDGTVTKSEAARKVVSLVGKYK